MKHYILIASLLVVGMVQAEVLSFAGGSTVVLSDDGGSAGVDQTITATHKLQNDSGGDLNWDVGEKFTLSFDMTVSDPDWITTAGAFQVGLGDNSEAVAFGVRLASPTAAFWNNGIDGSAGGPGGVSVGLGSASDRTQVSNSVVGTAFDLGSGGESAGFKFEATRDDVDTYTLTTTWLDSLGNELDSVTYVRDAASAAAGDTVDTFDELLFRFADSGDVANSSYSMSNFSMTVIPEPSTLGLVVAMGFGLVGVRRLFM